MQSQEPQFNNSGMPGTIVLRSEIDLLNQRLDAIDKHCKEFARIAQDKADLEDKLKNLAYIQLLN